MITTQSGRPAWTAGELRAAIAGLPDDTPVVAWVTVDAGDGPIDEQVIVSAGFGETDWGDGYGLEPSPVFGLTCEIFDGELQERPDRPRKEAAR